MNIHIWKILLGCALITFTGYGGAGDVGIMYQDFSIRNISNTSYESTSPDFTPWDGDFLVVWMEAEEPRPSIFINLPGVDNTRLPNTQGCWNPHISARDGNAHIFYTCNRNGQTAEYCQTMEPLGLREERPASDCRARTFIPYVSRQ